MSHVQGTLFGPTKCADELQAEAERKERRRMSRRSDPATSRKAAEKVDLKGCTGRMFRAFQDLAISQGPATSREAAEYCMACFQTGNTDLETHRKRYTNLKTRGLIEDCGEKVCRHTGEEVTSYRLTELGRTADVTIASEFKPED
ncbi:MAG: hypothetical protein Fues2KO_47540 [Fuerstiella sp.]